jgi:hypothetical protein
MPGEKTLECFFHCLLAMKNHVFQQRRGFGSIYIIKVAPLSSSFCGRGNSNQTCGGAPKNFLDNIILIMLSVCPMTGGFQPQKREYGEKP